MRINLLNFFKICILTLFKPTKAAKELKKVKNRKCFGISAFIMVAILYTLTTIICWLQNVSVSWAPILPINANDYYFYQIFFGIPVVLISWFLFAIICFLFLRKSNKELNFNQVFYSLSFPFFIPMLPLMWMTETVLIIFFPNLWTGNPYLYFPSQIALIFEIYMILYLILTGIWIIISIIFYLKYFSRKSFSESLGISICAYIPALFFIILFIR